MIRSRNIAIYYRLIVYSNIKDVLFGQKGSVTILASALKVIYWTRIRQLMAKP